MVTYVDVLPKELRVELDQYKTYPLFCTLNEVLQNNALKFLSSNLEWPTKNDIVTIMNEIKECVFGSIIDVDFNINGKTAYLRICHPISFDILIKLFSYMFNSGTKQSMYMNRIPLGSIFMNAINDKLINDNYVERFVSFTHGNVTEILLVNASSLSQEN